MPINTINDRARTGRDRWTGLAWPLPHEQRSSSSRSQEFHIKFNCVVISRDLTGVLQEMEFIGEWNLMILLRDRVLLEDHSRSFFDAQNELNENPPVFAFHFADSLPASFTG